MRYGIQVAYGGEPAAEPISTVEAKQHLKVDANDDDALIDVLVSAARRHFEAITGFICLATTFDLVLDAFPCSAVEPIELPRAPIISIDAITYLDGAGDTQTLSSYIADTKRITGRIFPAYAASWPVTRAQANAVTVQFTAGHATAAAVPADIIAALKLMLGHWYQNREEVVVGNIVTPMPFAAETIINRYHHWL